MKFTRFLIPIISVVFICYIVSILASLGFRSWYENLTQGDAPIPIVNEVVMPPNSFLTATTNAGEIRIRSGSGLKRYYTWDGVTRYVVMWPRQQRWYGSLGIYYPGPGHHWLPTHDGISRGLLEEGVQNFKTLNDALEWINKLKHWDPLVYRDDGLLVLFGKVHAKRLLNVSVWQICIKGEMPNKIPGSNNNLIETSWKVKTDTCSIIK